MHSPYATPATDALYNGLFCDDLEALLPPEDGMPPAWAITLTGGPAFAGALRRLANDPAGDARVRALAFRELQAQGHTVAARQLLGVVVEVPLDSGLDTLAAYADGSVRFIHGSGRMTLVEGPNEGLQPIVQRLLAASQTVVNCIGPSDQPRRPAPQRNVRMSFIVSDGLYFGEGPMQTLMADGMAGPVLQTAVELLNEITSLVAA
jgi:hypothetical protein